VRAAQPSKRELILVNSSALEIDINVKSVPVIQD